MSRSSKTLVRCRTTTTLIDEGSLKVLEATAQRRVSIFDLFRYPYLQRCVVAYLALLSPFIVFYVITIYGPSILQRMGAGKEDALYYTSALLFWTVITTAIAGAVGDKISRRWGLVIIMTITAAGTVALGQPLSQAGTIAAAIVVWGFVYAGFPLAKLYMAEQFPTRLRATGSMLGESITRFLGGVVLVYLFPIMSAAMDASTLYLILGRADGGLHPADLDRRLPNLGRQRRTDRHRSVGARQDGTADLAGPPITPGR